MAAKQIAAAPPSQRVHLRIGRLGDGDELPGVSPFDGFVNSVRSEMARLEGLINNRKAPTFKSTPFGQLHHSIPFQPGDLDKTKEDRKAAAAAAAAAKAANAKVALAAKAKAEAASKKAKVVVTAGAGAKRAGKGGASSTENEAAVAAALVPAGKRSKAQVELIAHRVRLPPCIN